MKILSFPTVVILRFLAHHLYPPYIMHFCATKADKFILKKSLRGVYLFQILFLARRQKLSPACIRKRTFKGFQSLFSMPSAFS